MKQLIENALIVNEGRSFRGALLIDQDRIAAVYEGDAKLAEGEEVERIDAAGKWLLPGVIDDHVHFREPGLTHKGTIASESAAAVAGGVTSYMEMPNTMPQTTTLEAWEWKMQRASECSSANYSFYFGGTNDNFDLLSRLDHSLVPGIKLFLGSSTGNMLVDRAEALRRFFGETDLMIAVHAEKEGVIKRNKAHYIDLFGEELDVTFHPKIRDEEACYASSSEAVELAHELGGRLHLLHLSTAKEMGLLSNTLPLSDKKVTGEVCVHHLWFSDQDYAQYGNLIKWNPAIKSAADREALRAAVNSGLLDVVGTDHAPHLLSEKEGNCLTAASGGPLVQHSLVTMLEMVREGIFTLEKVVEMMAHHPATLYRITNRGYLRPGYYADLVLVDPHASWEVSKTNVLSKCGWSPFEGQQYQHSVSKTWVNGQLVYQDGEVNRDLRALPLVYS